MEVNLPEEMLLLPLVATTTVLVFRVMIPVVLLPVELFVFVANSIEVDTPRLDRCELKLSYYCCNKCLYVFCGFRALFPLINEWLLPCRSEVEVMDFFWRTAVFVWLFVMLRFEIEDYLSSLFAENFTRSTLWAIEFIPTS